MNSSLQHLSRNGWLRRVDAALGEWVARAFPDSAPDVTLAAALAARAVNEGHSALRLDAAQTWCAGSGGTGRAPTLPDPVAWQTSLRASAAVTQAFAFVEGDGGGIKPMVLDAQGRVYLSRYFGYEQRLARDLIARAHTQRLQLITGGPGTGKTHSVVRLLAGMAAAAHAQSRTLRIALAAPTGKAAARLATSVRTQLPELGLADPVAVMIPQQAQTLHRLLGLSPANTRARFHRDAPLPYDVVVVDEVSMVDLPTMCRLVEAVHPNALLILLGDPDQLAAVEAGDVLGALVEAARAAPLSQCRTHLAHSHRFAEHGALGRLASAIAQGNADAALQELERGGEVKLLPNDQLAPLIEHAVEAYRDVVHANDAGAAMIAANRFRVLTALRHGPAGNLALDLAIEQRLKREASVRASESWWRGRLLMVTMNRPELNLFNGDVGVVWPDANGDPRVWFEGADDTLRSISPAALPPHEGAFALTVHKAQGSEFGRVVLVPGADTPVLTRELLYTGVTRARDGVEIYCSAALLRAGIERRTLRWNGLADRLRETAELASIEKRAIAESLPDTP